MVETIRLYLDAGDFKNANVEALSKYLSSRHNLEQEASFLHCLNQLQVLANTQDHKMSQDSTIELF